MTRFIYWLAFGALISGAAYAEEAKLPKAADKVDYRQVFANYKPQTRVATAYFPSLLEKAAKGDSPAALQAVTDIGELLHLATTAVPARSKLNRADVEKDATKAVELWVLKFSLGNITQAERSEGAKRMKTLLTSPDHDPGLIAKGLVKVFEDEVLLRDETRDYFKGKEITKEPKAVEILIGEAKIEKKK